MMIRILSTLLMLFLFSCGPLPEERLAADGRPLPKIYKLSQQDASIVQFRMLDAINALREQLDVGELELNSELTAAAATHARDMSIQNRPWHFGSDGSSPLERARRAGYSAQFLGELISETYESELVTLEAWVADESTRFILLDESASEMGFSWYQEPTGKIWWALVTGGPALSGRDVRAE